MENLIQSQTELREKKIERNRRGEEEERGWRRRGERKREGEEGRKR